MNEFVACSLLSEETQPVERVRLVGYRWFIEVCKHDEHTIEVRAGGSMSVLLSVLPRSSNVVYVTTDVENRERVHEEAVRVAGVWKANEDSARLTRNKKQQ